MTFEVQEMRPSTGARPNGSLNQPVKPQDKTAMAMAGQESPITCKVGSATFTTARRARFMWFATGGRMRRFAVALVGQLRAVWTDYLAVRWSSVAALATCSDE